MTCSKSTTGQTSHMEDFDFFKLLNVSFFLLLLLFTFASFSISLIFSVFSY